MIYTLTLNPSLDYMVEAANFKQGIINRPESTRLYPGGKGINVSIVLSNLGFQSTALGFTAGETGRLFEAMLFSMGINCDFINVHGGSTRINVKIKSEQETEINAPGPQIDSADLEKLIAKLSAVSSGDTLVLAGSVPPSLPTSVYADILDSINTDGVRIIADTAGSALTSLLRHNPFMIKPNHIELGEIFGIILDNDDDIISCAQKLRADGAQNVFVSKGGNGALLAAADGRVYCADAPAGEVVGTVGSGDSAVAGFVAAVERNGNYEHALRLAVSAGSASAFSPHLASGEEIMQLYDKNFK